ncbi:MAG: O-antigen ligase family protein [Proteobacteria bacterium]|nr:O-antigen ligase family protein [Pseudomonadota bacterium]
MPAAVRLQYWPTRSIWDPDTERVWGQFAYYAMVAGLITNALAAYAFGPVPIEWLARVIFILAAAMMMLSGTLPKVPSLTSLTLLFQWAFITTVVGYFDHSIELHVPILTTPYPVFIGLRFFNLLAPIGCAYLVVAASERYSYYKLTNFIIWLGTIASLYAIYAYVAEVYGLPEIARTRLGTGGGAQSTTFSYAFHRALGTFREPSHLAEWLLAPLFTSFALRNRILNIHTLIMTLTMLLTGSLAGIAGLGAGIFAATLLGNPLRASSWRVAGGFIGVLLCGIAGFLVFAAGKNIDVFTLFDVLGGRAGKILFGGGLLESNRGDVLAAALHQPISFFGYGFGRANVYLSNIYTQNTTDATPFILDYHSLYLHYLFATGVVGLTLLLIFIATPIYLFLSHRLRQIRPQFAFLVGGVVAYAVTNTLLFDEMTPQFAMMVALVIVVARSQSTFSPSAPAGPHVHTTPSQAALGSTNA